LRNAPLSVSSGLSTPRIIDSTTNLTSGGKVDGVQNGTEKNNDFDEDY